MKGLVLGGVPSFHTILTGQTKVTSEEQVAKFSIIKVSSQLSTQSHRKFSLGYLKLIVGMPVLR